ncbi:hypothetical protein P3G55_17015 [Leptospira sp. 96542]|nr:hypothetical protein [Leptospira sp. 96542]
MIQKAKRFFPFFTFVVFLIVLTLPILGQAQFDFPDTNPGQYIFYKDTRGGQNRLTGIFKFPDGTIICRTVDTIKNVSSTITVEVQKTKNGIEIVPAKVIEGDFERDIQYLLVDFNNIASQQFLNQSKISDKKNTTEDPWPEFGYTLEHTFWKFIPFFNLYSMRRTDLETSFYEVAIMGRMAHKDDVSFFKINLPLTNENSAAKFKIPKKNEKSIESSGYQIPLDENWKVIPPDKEKNLYHETIWLSVSSMRDAQIGIETIDTSLLGNKFQISSPMDFANRIINSNTLLIANTIKIENISPNEVVLSYVVIDTETKLQTISINKIKKVDATNYHIINFSAFLETYEENKPYFIKIIKNTKPIKK